VSKIEAVIFDLYETLISEFKDGARKVSRVHRDYQELIGIPNEVFRKEWSARQEKRMTGFFPNFKDVVKDIAETVNFECSEENMERLYRDRIHEKSVPFEDIRADIIELLEGLQKRGIKLGLVSNCTEEEVKSWQSSRLAPYFDEVIFSYETGYAKPDPRIYELACKRLGVRAEQCIFVGDGGSNELDGARQAGLSPYQAIWFLPESFSGRITNHKKLERPEKLLEEINR
jgi:HAD superfamily hydrolase (TIGR01549 family)